MKLNLGCGKDIRKGYVNVDQMKPCDVLHDLNRFPYPFKDNSVDEINARHVVEHLDDTVRVMEELWRICKPGAEITIICPHYSHINAYRNPTHRRYFALNSFDFFSVEGFYGEKYGKCDFEILSRKVNTKILPLRLRILERLAPALGGIGEIEVRLKVVK